MKEKNICLNNTAKHCKHELKLHITDEGLTLETSAFNLFPAANLPYQLS